MSTDDLREKLRDELAGFPIGAGGTAVGADEAREMADALLRIIDAHVNRQLDRYAHWVADKMLDEVLEVADDYR